MHTIRMYFGAADGLYIYIVGFQHNTPNNFDPMVACETLGKAMAVCSYLQGGQPPADYTPWLNVMKPQSGTAPVITKDGDFKRGAWVMPEQTK